MKNRLPEQTNIKTGDGTSDLKHAPSNESPGPGDFLGEFCQSIKEKQMPTHLKHFQRNGAKQKGRHPNSPYRASIYPHTSPNKESRGYLLRILHVNILEING